MRVDIERNKTYYKSEDSIPCNCGDCINYINKIENKYPFIKSYLDLIGVDVLRPFELSSINNEEEKTVEYISSQYLVFGECEDDFKETILGIEIVKGTSYPGVPEYIKDKWFILEVIGIILSLD